MVVNDADAGTNDADSHVNGHRWLVQVVLGRPVHLLFAYLIVIAAVGGAIGLSLPTWARYLPLGLSVVLFGLPHGAVDHLVPSRLGTESPLPVEGTRQSAAAVGVLYLVLGGGYAVGWLTVPRLAALAFIALTWFHWGQGDVWLLRDLLGADHLRSRAVRWGTLLVRGGLPMLVPLLAFPDRYRAVLSAWVGLFGVALELPRLFALRTRVILGAGFALLSLGTLVAGRMVADDSSTGRRRWRIDAAEVGLLWAYFALVPPLVAVGLYFTCWHALRHIARLLLLAPDRTPPESPTAFTVWLWGAGRRFAREAAPLTLLSLVLLVGFGLVVPADVETVPEYAALYLVFVAVVTLPHVVVVTLMDAADGVWADDRPLGAP